MAVKKIFFAFLALVLCLAFFIKPVKAVYDPVQVPNNRFGIHLASPADLNDAARLVNSSGGDWGYITFVIRKDERDVQFWQTVFDQARRSHLIPIVRIATYPQNGMWEKPNNGDLDGWVSFLNSLNWVIENRYVVIANEPNHASEWGGIVSPKEYAIYLKTFSQRLKSVSEDFFVLPAGLDASAPNSKITMEESLFINQMLQAEPKIFDYVDGWTSHSYPNPNFSGSEYAQGKGSIRTFEWESSFLKSLGIKKDLPVFITETGWAHNNFDKYSHFAALDKVGQKYSFAFQNVWNKEKVVAVTPFIINYPDAPFAMFSWKDKNGNFFPFFNEVEKLNKTKGQPEQETKGKLLAAFIRPIQKSNSEFSGICLVENNGQSIWENGSIKVISENNNILKITGTNLGNIEPNKSGIIQFKGKIIAGYGFHLPEVSLAKSGSQFTNSIHLPIIILPGF